MSRFGTKPIDRNALAALLIAAGSLGAAGSVMAAADHGACAPIAGVYVTTVTDREGVFASRGLMTFTAGGVLLVSDSAQGGVPGVWDPFTTTQGIWECQKAGKGQLAIRAIGLNFILPGDGRTPSFGRVEYQARLDSETGMLSGRAVLRFTPKKDLEGADPTDKPGSVVDEFQFEGQRLQMPR